MNVSQWTLMQRCQLVRKIRTMYDFNTVLRLYESYLKTYDISSIKFKKSKSLLYAVAQKSPFICSYRLCSTINFYYMLSYNILPFFTSSKHSRTAQTNFPAITGILDKTYQNFIQSSAAFFQARASFLTPPHISCLPQC